MSLPNRAALLSPIILGWLLSAQCARADQWYPIGNTNQSSLQISFRTEESVGETQIQRIYFTVGTNQIALLVPDGFRADASDPQKVVFSDRHSSCFITFRFASASPADTQESSVEFYRNLALSRFPGADISAEFSSFSGLRCGPAFDLQWTNSGGSQQSARIVFIPSPAGLMELSLLTPSSRFKESQIWLRVTLASLRSNERGKIPPQPHADAS